MWVKRHMLVCCCISPRSLLLLPGESQRGLEGTIEEGRTQISTSSLFMVIAVRLMATRIESRGLSSTATLDLFIFDFPES